MAEHTQKRLDFIDATRGIAMLLVCFSHFCMVYGRTAGDYFRSFDLFTMTAAPTFMLVSGFLLGYFYTSKKEKINTIVKQYIYRGIIMLTLGHLLICLSNIPRSNGFLTSFNTIYITDTIAFCTICGPLLISRLNYLQRIAAGLSLQLIAWIMLILWNPFSPLMVILKVICFGSLGGSSNYHLVNYSYFPILPWFGYYLIATAVGEKSGLGITNKIYRKYMIMSGILSIFTGLAIKMLYYFIESVGYIAASQTYIFRLTSPAQKDPPSMAYFLFYAGIGFLIISIVWKINDSNVPTWLISPFILIGKNSLFAFILQCYIYYLIFYILALPFSFLWPLYFLISIVCYLILIFIWQKLDGNRFLYMKFISKKLFADVSASDNKSWQTVVKPE